MNNVLVAGLEALSMISMLNPPKNPVRAISRWKLNEIVPYLIEDRDRIADEKLTEIEVWSYDPSVLSKEKYVDIASLAISLKGSNDERIEQSLEEGLKREPWFTG